MITTFIFDIGNVLLNFNFLDQYRALYDEQTAQALADATVRNTALWTEMDRGTLSYEEAIALLQKNAPHLHHQIPHAIRTMYERLESYPYADAWLQSLKQKGYRVYILSNYGQVPYEMTRERMGFLKHADGALISYEVQQTKPNHTIYQAICDKFGIIPSEAVFLDDSPINIEGAKTFGLHTVLFTDYPSALEDLAKLPLAYGL